MTGSALTVVVESPEPSALRPFWQRVLGYEVDGDSLVDPLQRDPAFRFVQSDELRPLRHRVHVDVVRPASVVEGLGLGEPSGPYGVRHADADGNEVDMVPGDPLGDTDATADWQAVFAAMACYRTTTPEQQRDLVAAATSLAADVDFPLRVDVGPGLVVLDSGKDMAEPDAHGLDLDFTDLAARVQAAARDLGAVPDSTLPRFVQLFLDAADVDAVRAFWLAALHYVPDRRDIPDLHDPRRADPVLVFQQLDLADTARREQRNRIFFELALPADFVQPRLDAALSAGGRLLSESDGRWHVTDPEGNELVYVS